MARSPLSFGPSSSLICFSLSCHCSLLLILTIESARRPGSAYYDPASTKDKARWSLVHVEFRTKFALPISLREMRELGKPGGPLEHMQMLKQSRLSVSRVSGDEWETLRKLADKKALGAGLQHEHGKFREQNC